MGFGSEKAAGPETDKPASASGPDRNAGRSRSFSVPLGLPGASRLADAIQAATRGGVSDADGRERDAARELPCPDFEGTLAAAMPSLAPVDSQDQASGKKGR